MRECREEWGEGGEVMSSDEDTLTNQIPDEEEPPFISEEDYRKMLRVHRESQMRKRVSHTPCHAPHHLIWCCVCSDGAGPGGQRDWSVEREEAGEACPWWVEIVSLHALRMPVPYSVFFVLHAHAHTHTSLYYITVEEGHPVSIMPSPSPPTVLTLFLILQSKQRW